MAQLVKNRPVVRETWVQSPGWEDPLEKRKAPTAVFCPENSMDYRVMQSGSLVGYRLWGRTESDTTEAT